MAGVHRVGITLRRNQALLFIPQIFPQEQECFLFLVLLDRTLHKVDRETGR